MSGERAHSTRCYNLSAAVTREEHAAVKRAARAAHQSISEFVREQVLGSNQCADTADAVTRALEEGLRSHVRVTIILNEGGHIGTVFADGPVTVVTFREAGHGTKASPRGYSHAAPHDIHRHELLPPSLLGRAERQHEIGRIDQGIPLRPEVKHDPESGA